MYVTHSARVNWINGALFLERELLSPSSAIAPRRARGHSPIGIRFDSPSSYRSRAIRYH
jgi:hypothetical protein